MPAREHESGQHESEAEVEAAAPQTEDPQSTFTTEGDLPAIAGAGAATAATASELAFDGKEQAAPNTNHLDHGIHHWESYRAACEAAGKPDKWKDYYRNGHTQASQWEQPYEHRRVNDWTLKRGKSASQALKDWIAGPTIADYRAALLSDEIDEVRDELGDQKFDQLFGSENDTDDSKIPERQRLRLSSDLYTTPLADQMRAIAAQHDLHDSTPESEAPAPVVEARVEEKPKAAQVEQDPVVVAQELGIEQRDREIV
jgi:hypothetical protein